MGFFTEDDVKAGDELTFDYQYERGDISQECFCGAPTCRGTIRAPENASERKSSSSGKRRRVDSADYLSPATNRGLSRLQRELRKLVSSDGALLYDSTRGLVQMMLQNQTSGSSFKSELLTSLELTNDDKVGAERPIPGMMKIFCSENIFEERV